MRSAAIPATSNRRNPASLAMYSIETISVYNWNGCSKRVLRHNIMFYKNRGKKRKARKQENDHGLFLFAIVVTFEPKCHGLFETDFSVVGSLSIESNRTQE